MGRLLTQREIDRLAEPGRYAVGHGAYLQIANNKSRTKAWLFRYRRNGRARHVGMGSAVYVSLKRAREKAIEYRQMLADGRDPLAEKRGIKLERQRAEARSKAFDQVAREYIAAHEDTWRGDSSRRDWIASLERHVFPKIGTISIADINVTDVLTVLDPIARSIPETAGRIRQRIAKILDWAHARDLRPNDNPARRPNLLPKRKRSKGHFTAMAYTALPGFMCELRQRSGIDARALELLVLTAARPGEALGMRWDEVDLGAATWIIPGKRMKSGRPHRVPLSGRSVELLAALPHEGEYVFSGRFPGTRPSPHLLTRVLHRMGHRVTAHGFRSSFRTWAGEQTAYPRELIEVALAHAVGDETERAYARGDMLARRRQLMEAWSEYCGTPRAEGDVVPLRTSA
jgi:integrase